MSETCCSTCEPRAASSRAKAAARTGGRAALTAGSGALIVLGVLTTQGGYAPWSVAAYMAAIALSIATPLRRAAGSIRRRTLDINVLMVIAVAGAIALGDWFEAATVVWLFGVAQWLEARSMDRAQRAIRSLVMMAPTTAIVRRGAAEQEVSVNDIAEGDVVVVRPGERIPVDGMVVTGESAIDQSPVTGESWPVEKSSGRRCPGGHDQWHRGHRDSGHAPGVPEHARAYRPPCRTSAGRASAGSEARRSIRTSVYACGRDAGDRRGGRTAARDRRRGRVAGGRGHVELSGACTARRGVPVRAGDLDAGVDRLGADGCCARRGAHQGRQPPRAARRDRLCGVRQDRHDH